MSVSWAKLTWNVVLEKSERTFTYNFRCHGVDIQFEFSLYLMPRAVFSHACGECRWGLQWPFQSPQATKFHWNQTLRFCNPNTKTSMRSLISIDFPAPEMEPESACVISCLRSPAPMRRLQCSTTQDNIHQSVATPLYSATPWYLLIQESNIIDTISKRWQSKKAFNTGEAPAEDLQDQNRVADWKLATADFGLQWNTRGAVKRSETHSEAHSETLFFSSGMADHALRLGPYMRRSS